MAKQYLISDFLKRIKRPIDLEDETEYKLVTIKMNHKGVVLREHKKGKDIKSGMYLVKQGDFILSGIDARNGAFGIVPPELDNAIVTNDFWYFQLDESIILKELFLELTATTWFDEICKKGSDGTTQRIRLQKDKFFNQLVWLPSKKEQPKILSKIQKFKRKQRLLNNEYNEQAIIIEQLKQSILLEAIQGKLTAEWRKENPDVEPASELLKRIKAEKEQLVIDKKIKKEKPLPPINKYDIPFELPKSWVWCRLEEIAKSLIGLTYKPTDIAVNGIGVLRSNNIQNGNLVLSDLVKVKAEVPSSKMTTIGDILICVRNGSKRLIGKVAIINEEGYSFGAFMGVIRTRINYHYLYYFLSSAAFRNQIDDEKSTGINQLTQGILNQISVVLPPLEEQQVMVEKIEALLGECHQLNNEIDELNKHSKNLIKALFNEMFSVESNV